jgi:hypothetical protein
MGNGDDPAKEANAAKNANAFAGIRFDPGGEMLLILRASLTSNKPAGGEEAPAEGKFGGGGTGSDPPVFGGGGEFMISIPVSLIK